MYAFFAVDSKLKRHNTKQADKQQNKKKLVSYIMKNESNDNLFVGLATTAIIILLLFQMHILWNALRRANLLRPLRLNSYANIHGKSLLGGLGTDGEREVAKQFDDNCGSFTAAYKTCQWRLVIDTRLRLSLPNDSCFLF